MWRWEIENYLYDKPVLQAYCSAIGLTFDEAAYDGFVTNIVDQNVKDATGRIKDQPKVSHVGMDLIQALLMAEAITQTLKYTTRRERPDGSGKNSFPSGHAADTFAFATAFERHIGWKGAVPAYLFSSYVAISRLPDNRHWLSDTVFGAGVGIIAGRTATRHGAKYPMSAAIVRGGVEIMFSRNYAAN